ncbi:MAG: hypothetical protein ABIR47_18180 [Candidatus Kapaibacterium sp.]
MSTEIVERVNPGRGFTLRLFIFLCVFIAFHVHSGFTYRPTFHIIFGFMAGFTGLWSRVSFLPTLFWISMVILVETLAAYGIGCRIMEHQVEIDGGWMELPPYLLEACIVLALAAGVIGTGLTYSLLRNLRARIKARNE